MFRKQTLVICILIILIVSACEQSYATEIVPTEAVSIEAAPVDAMPVEAALPLPPVTLIGTELMSLTSANTGRDYDIYIRLPASYTLLDKKLYPILYVLDGQWDFKLYDSIYGGLQYDGFVPEMIIVGITYSGQSPDYETLRAMDLTPVPVNYHPGSGDAPKFLSFIKDELIPLVESNYRADPSQRILTGSSYAGLFTLYTLFSEPSLFSGYISGSPVVTFGGGVLYDMEKTYATQHQDLPVRLYIAVGELEDLQQPVVDFVGIIQDRNYEDLVMESQVVLGERHAGNKPEAFNRGLRFIFQGK